MFSTSASSGASVLVRAAGLAFAASPTDRPGLVDDVGWKLHEQGDRFTRVVAIVRNGRANMAFSLDADELRLRRAVARLEVHFGWKFQPVPLSAIWPPPSEGETLWLRRHADRGHFGENSRLVLQRGGGWRFGLTQRQLRQLAPLAILRPGLQPALIPDELPWVCRFTSMARAFGANLLRFDACEEWPVTDGRGMNCAMTVGPFMSRGDERVFRRIVEQICRLDEDGGDGGGLTGFFDLNYPDD